MATKPTRRLDAFFEELCVMYGWCLSAAERRGIEDGATDELQKFVDRVIETYTHQPADLCDRRQRLWVTDVADRWLFDPRGVGARSGLA